MTPSFPQRWSCSVQPYEEPDVRHLRMSSCSLHPVCPCAFSILKQEFPADLLEVPALQCMLAGAQALEYRLNRVDEDVRLHVCGLGTKIVGASHAEVVVELARRVSVYGEGTSGRFGVHGYQFGATAADDSDEGGYG